MSQVQNLLVVSENCKSEVRKKLGVTYGDIRDNLKCLKDWLKKMPHLPKHISESRLEYFMIHNHMSVEKVKMALEGYFTARSVFSDYFDKLVPHTIYYQRVKSFICTVAIPKMTDDFERITITKLTNSDSDLYDPLESLILLSMISEIRFIDDYNYRDIIIIDFQGYSLKHLVKFTPKIIRKMRYIIMKTFQYKVKDIHFINVPPFSDKILPVLRGIIPGHLYKKVHMHMSLEHLYENVPKEYLPLDYGGEQPSLIDLFTKWCEELEYRESFFAEHMYVKSDEKKRVGRNHEFEIFGTGSQGSFKIIKNE